MDSRRCGQRGSSVLCIVVLSPLILLSMALVVEVGTLELVKQRLHSAADVAAESAAATAAHLTTVGRIDSAAGDAAMRAALIENLRPLAGRFDGSDAYTVAANADVLIVAAAPADDPLHTGRTLVRPTIEARLRVPVRSGLLAVAGLGRNVVMTIDASADVRLAGNS